MPKSARSGAARIRAVSFDLDDTLWPVAPTLARAELELTAWLEQRYPRIGQHYDLAAIRALRARIMAEQPHLSENMTALRKAVIGHAARHAGYGEDVVEPAFAVFLHHRNEVAFYPEVLAVLETLAQRYALGAISNGNADFRKVGLGHLMSFAISAAEFGKAKPHPDTFRAAAEAIGVPLPALVHVGDDPRTDVAGAAGAGLRTVWVNRTDAAWPADLHPGVAPDVEIHALDELPDALERLAGSK